MSNNLFDVYPLFPIEIVKGKGCKVWDKNGQEYLDLYGGHAVISIGHSHPTYVEKLSSQLQKIGFYSNAVIISQQEELAKKLVAMSGCKDYNLFLCNSGAEANENALKLASFHTGRKKIICFTNAFHGRTSLAVATTDNPGIIAPVNENEHIQFLPFNDVQALEKAIDKDTAAVIVEGIQGIGGVYEPGVEFLTAIENLCKENGAVFIADEIQSGYGRSGKFFAFQHKGVQPDIIPIAKGMGNGFPIGGILIAPHIKAKHGMLGTTFGGNYLACAAGLAVLEVMEKENLVQHTSEMGEYVLEKLKAIPQIKELRGRGLMIGIELEESCAPVRKRLLEDFKIFTGSASNKNTLRILPPLNVGKEALDYFVDCLQDCLQKSS